VDQRRGPQLSHPLNRRLHPQLRQRASLPGVRLPPQRDNRAHNPLASLLPNRHYSPAVGRRLNLLGDQLRFPLHNRRFDQPCSQLDNLVPSLVPDQVDSHH
jgi:hypothetical protein